MLRNNRETPIQHIVALAPENDFHGPEAIGLIERVIVFAQETGAVDAERAEHLRDCAARRQNIGSTLQMIGDDAADRAERHARIVLKISPGPMLDRHLRAPTKDRAIEALAPAFWAWIEERAKPVRKTGRKQL